eukprot:2087778-Rhodomonas_salina.1
MWRELWEEGRGVAEGGGVRGAGRTCRSGSSAGGRRQRRPSGRSRRACPWSPPSSAPSTTASATLTPPDPSAAARQARAGRSRRRAGRGRGRGEGGCGARWVQRGEGEG